MENTYSGVADPTSDSALKHLAHTISIGWDPLTVTLSSCATVLLIVFVLAVHHYGEEI